MTRFSYLDVEAGDPPLDLSLLPPASAWSALLVIVTGEVEEEEGEATVVVGRGCV